MVGIHGWNTLKMMMMMMMMMMMNFQVVATLANLVKHRMILVGRFSGNFQVNSWVGPYP